MSKTTCRNGFVSFGRSCPRVCCTGMMAFLFCFLLLINTAEAQLCEPGAVLNGDDDPWSWQCYLNQSCLEQGNPCTANDVTLTGAYLADEFGNPILACQAGQPVQAFLWGLFRRLRPFC